MVAERAIETSVLKRENLEFRQKERRDTAITSSGAINCLRAAIDRVAPTNSRVLITGPSGSGKVAAPPDSRSIQPGRVVRRCELRHDDPGRELELSNHPATTERARVGMFEQAHNGTLFLDEVAELPLETQGNCSRSSRTGLPTHWRLQMVQVDVRVVASATKDICGKLRKATSGKISIFIVVPIEIPP